MDPELFNDPRFLKLYNDPQSEFARNKYTEEIRQLIADSGEGEAYTEEQISGFADNKVAQEAYRRFMDESGIGQQEEAARISRQISGRPGSGEQLTRLRGMSEGARERGEQSREVFESFGETNPAARLGKTMISRGGGAATNIGRFLHRGAANAVNALGLDDNAISRFLELDEGGEAAEESGRFFRNIAPITEAESGAQRYMESAGGMAAEIVPFVAGAAPAFGVARFGGKALSSLGRTVGGRIAPKMTSAVTSQPASALGRFAKTTLKTAPTEAAGAVGGLATALPEDVISGELDLGEAAPLMAALGIAGAGARGYGAAKGGVPGPKLFNYEQAEALRAKTRAEPQHATFTKSRKFNSLEGEAETAFLRAEVESAEARVRKLRDETTEVIEPAERVDPFKSAPEELAVVEELAVEQIPQKVVSLEERLRSQLTEGRDLQARVRKIGDKRLSQSADDLFRSAEDALEEGGTTPLHAEGLKNIDDLLTPILEALQAKVKKGGAPITTGARFRGRKGKRPKGKGGHSSRSDR